MCNGILPNQRVEDIAKGLANTARASARAATPQWGRSITLVTPLLGGELSECVKCSSLPLRVTEVGELVRIHFNFSGCVADQDYLSHLLMREIEPFIIGVGQVKVGLTAEGVVVRRAEFGIADDCHV